MINVLRCIGRAGIRWYFHYLLSFVPCPSHLSAPWSFSQYSLLKPFQCPYNLLASLFSSQPPLLFNTTTNPYHPGSSSEMAIFCDVALDWILERTSDPKSVSALRVIGQQMSTKFTFSDKHPSGVNFCPSKDRPLWPLPDMELARTYVDGMLCPEDTKEEDKETR